MEEQTAIETGQVVQMTSTEFRKHPGRAFELVKSGQPVAISYRGELFDIVLREDDELEITPELLEAIRESREQYARGEYIEFSNHEDLQAWFDSQK
jgi:hypothetical protein